MSNRKKLKPSRGSVEGHVKLRTIRRVAVKVRAEKLASANLRSAIRKIEDDGHAPIIGDRE